MGSFIRESVLNPIASVDDGQQDVCLGEIKPFQNVNFLMFSDCLMVSSSIEQQLIQYSLSTFICSTSILPQTIPALEFTVRGLPEAAV